MNVERLEDRLMLSGTPALSSFPGAPAKLHLDFDGHFEAQWGGHSSVSTPAWNGTPEQITEIWTRVAEDFAPFNVDVTTIDPGAEALGDGRGLRAVVSGGNSKWLGERVGGTSQVDGFSRADRSNVVYVFPMALKGDTKYVAEAISHEIGHAFGLRHQSDYDAAGNLLREHGKGGKGSVSSPIMGLPYSRPVTRWAFGPNEFGLYSLQDDIALIARSENGFGLRDDVWGIIGTADDVDSQEVEWAGGLFEANAFGAEFGQNLDIKLTLVDEQGRIVAESSDPRSLDARLTVWLEAGWYRLDVSGSGAYGDIGAYTVVLTEELP